MSSKSKTVVTKTTLTARDILGFTPNTQPLVTEDMPTFNTAERMEALATHADTETATLVPHKRLGRY